MKISNLTECTTAGAVATVAQPFETVQKRTPEKKLKGSNLLKGIKTSEKYANSLHESADGLKVGDRVRVTHRTNKHHVFHDKVAKISAINPDGTYHLVTSWNEVGYDVPGEYLQRQQTQQKLKFEEGAESLDALKAAWQHHREQERKQQKAGNHEKAQHHRTQAHDINQQIMSHPDEKLEFTDDPYASQKNDALSMKNDTRFNEGFPHDVDHMNGPIMRGGEGMSKACPHCNGNRYIWTNSEQGKTPKHPWINPNTATLKSKQIPCPVCQGDKTKEHTDTEDGRNHANAFGTYRYESVEQAHMDNGKRDFKPGDSKSKQPDTTTKLTKDPEKIRQANALLKGSTPDKKGVEGREPMVGETCYVRGYTGLVVLQRLSMDKARIKFDNGRIETVSRMDLIPQSEKVYSLWEGKGVTEGSKKEDPVWNKGTPMPKDYTCHCGLAVHPSVRNPKAIHMSGCPYAEKIKGGGITEGALTTMQPRGEKPFRPSMDAPKKKYPAIGTVAWEQLPDWKRQELLKKRGHIKEQCLDEAQSFGGALNNALSKVEPGSKLDQKIKNHNRAVKSGSKDNLMTSTPDGYHFKKDGSIALGDNPVQEATKQNDYFKNRKDHEDRINGVPGAPKAKNIKQNSYFKTRKDQEDKITGKKVDEAQIKEDDVVLAPGKGRQFKPGLLNKPEVDEGRFTHGPGGVPLDRQGNAIPPKPPVAPKAPYVQHDKYGVSKAEYQMIWRKIEDVVGQIFPDGDPIDWLIPWFKQKRMYNLDMGDVLDKACRMNGFKDIYAYYDHFKTGDYGWEEPVREAMQADPAAPARTKTEPLAVAPDEQETDPELRSAEQSANVHYASAAKRKKGVEKFLLRSVKHAKEADTQQNLEIRKIKRDMDAIRKMASNGPVAEGEITEDDVVLSADRRRPKSGLLSKPEPTTNPADAVKVDIPLLIRLLEFAREDAKTDMDLHDLAEKLIACGARGRTLTMKDYERLVPEKKPEYNDATDSVEPEVDESLLGGAAAAGIIANDDDEDFQVSFQRQMEEDQTNHKFRILAFLKSNEPGDVGQRKEFTITARTDREAKILAKQRLAARGMEVRELHIIGSEEIA